MSNFNASIKAILDTSGVPKQIKDIENKYSIKLGLGQFDKSNISQQMKNLGSKAGDSFNQSFNSSLSKIKVNTGKSAIADMQRTLKSMNFNNSSIDIITKDLEQMNVSVNKVRTNLRGDNLRLSVQGVDELGRAVTVVKQFDSETRRISTVSKSFTQSFAQVPAMASSLQVSTLDNKMETWLQKNNRASKEFGKSIAQLRNKLSTLNSTGQLTEKQLDDIETEFKEIKQSAIAAGATGKTFGSTIKGAFSSISKYVGVSTIIYKTIESIREMYQNVYEIDTEMTELKKVTDETDKAYSKFLDNAGSKAKQIGTSISGFVSSTADFARLGYSFSDAQNLAEVANIYAVVGDEVESVDVATQSLVSTLAAFGKEVTALEVIDKFNEVGNNFAISSGGIGDALQRSASSLAAANNTLDQTIALITAANTVVQDPDSVGNAFKTVSMRIRGAKTELEEAGLETEGMVESTAKLRTEIMALSGVDIMEDENTFKATYDILDELADKWENLSDIQRATITELIAGKRQGNVISSLMNNFDVARDALSTSIGSSGSATEEHEKWLESIDAKTKQFEASWESLSNTILNSNIIKGGLDTGTGILSFIDKLIDELGSFGMALMAIPPLIAISKWTPFANVLLSIKNSFSNLPGGNKTMFL